MMSRLALPISIGPIARLSVGLAALTMLLLMLSDFLFGLSSNELLIQQQMRKQIAENLAAQAIVLVELGDQAPLAKSLNRVLISEPSLRSLAVRREDGTVFAERGDHLQHWDRKDDLKSSINQISVPIYANQNIWGRLEMAYSPGETPTASQFLKQPMLLTLLLMGGGGALIYYAYLRRALQYLDPTKTVPERVHKAFDTFTDAVVVLDLRGRILLANTAFKRLGGTDSFKIGNLIDTLPWIETAVSVLGSAPPPWTTTLNERKPVSDYHLTIKRPPVGDINLSINTSIVQDDDGNARGCLVSFTDQSRLEKANLELRQAIGEIEQSRAQIKAQNEKLQHLASRDPLTGCFNRRAFFEKSVAPFTSALRGNAELCCLMTDIDHFKSFNDIYGHAVGDQVIRAVASNIERHLRQHDILCRYGGEEFCVILIDVSQEDALNIAERIRISLAENGNKAVRSTDVRPITSSFGISSISNGANTIEQLIEQADQALYKSKENGRNQTTLWHPGN